MPRTNTDILHRHGFILLHTLLITLKGANTDSIVPVWPLAITLLLQCKVGRCANPCGTAMQGRHMIEI